VSSETYFTTRDSRWFRPTELTRGPWDPDACHAGPPVGLLARHAESLVPEQQLVRLTAEIIRPIPFAGFELTGSITRAGRRASTSEVMIVDEDGKTAVSARCLHITPGDLGEVPTPPSTTPLFDNARAGDFPIRPTAHDLPMFRDSAHVLYDAGSDPTPGPTAFWMQTPHLLPDENPSPFQRICPLADSGNAFSRNADIAEIGFINADLTILLHRAPVGDWLGMDAVSRWEPTGIGMSDSLLFDEFGPVGRALQSLILQRSDTR